MREIKFRAWHTEQKRMFSAEEMAEDQLTLLPTGKFINVHTHKQLSRIYDFMIPLQFTGLHDKNGKEIYEGDIVCIFDTRKYLVEWNYESHEWTLHNRSMSDQLEIIGNIHENPELLNQEV